MPVCMCVSNLFKPSWYLVVAEPEFMFQPVQTPLASSLCLSLHVGKIGPYKATELHPPLRAY